MTSDDRRARVFRRMLAREAGANADAPAVAAAARRLGERFAQQLNPLIGDAGVAALFARSLHLAERHAPGLAPVRQLDQDDGPFVLLQRSLEQQETAPATEVAVGMLATAGELSASFIGEGLTALLLRETWPDDFAGDTPQEATA